MEEADAAAAEAASESGPGVKADWRNRVLTLLFFST